MTPSRPPSVPHPRRKWLVGAAIALIVAGAVGWRLAGKGGEAKGARKSGGPVVVVSALAQTRDIPVRLTANGTVTALQTVDVRSQITSIVKTVHIREGQFVHAGEPL